MRNASVLDLHAIELEKRGEFSPAVNQKLFCSEHLNGDIFGIRHSLRITKYLMGHVSDFYGTRLFQFIASQLVNQLEACRARLD